MEDFSFEELLLSVHFSANIKQYVTKIKSQLQNCPYTRNVLNQAIASVYQLANPQNVPNSVYFLSDSYPNATEREERAHHSHNFRVWMMMIWCISLTMVEAKNTSQ